MSKRFIQLPYYIWIVTSIDSNCCRLPTACVISNKAGKSRFNQLDQQAQVSQRHTSCRNKENCSTEVHDDGGLEVVKPAREPAFSHSKPCAFLKNAPGSLPVRRSLLALIESKQTVVRDQFFPQKLPGSRLWFSGTRVQHSPGSSVIELPPALAESGAYSPDRACYGTFVRGSTIGEGGDTTISSTGRSPKQPLPGIRLRDPLHDRQACPEFIAFDQMVGQICPW